MPPSRSSIASDPSNPTNTTTLRLEPRLLKAAESDQIPQIESILTQARENGQFSAHLLRTGLNRACERNCVVAARYFLDLGAAPDPPRVRGPRAPVLKAAEKGHIHIVRVLLDYGVSVEASDKKGRNGVMTAAWKGYRDIVEMLICVGGADVNAVDAKGRNVLHNLAADKLCEWGWDVVEYILSTKCEVDARDELGRTPLHWACATGKPKLVQLLLKRTGQIADVNAVEKRNKTALHLAIAHGREDIVALLVSHKADINARSDGGWTPLHNACDTGSEAVVRGLLQAGAGINAQLLNGVTPLHLAAQAGHTAIVECLLERVDLKRRIRDNFGSTPFLRAAQFKRKDVVFLLAPSNNVEALSADARGACQGFDATIVDFGNFHNENKVKKTSVYNLLYGRDAENPLKQAVTTIPVDSTATDFRWIHLPANNMAWVEALLTKSFIEEGAHDVDGFKGIEKSFGYQHRGQRTHSHFMRPLCQSTPRTHWFREEPASDVDQSTLIASQESKSDSIPSHVNPKQGKPERTDSYSHDDASFQGKKGKKSAKGKTGGTPKKVEVKKKHPVRQDTRSSILSPCKEGHATCNVCAFMPFLHFESADKRQKMQAAIQRAETFNLQPRLVESSTRDEMLINAHLASSTASLHVRRTLDQFFYPNIDTETRDQDQVVYRYQKAEQGHDPKIFMVDQLWMWILGTNLIVTSFAQRWEQPKNDPLNVLDGIVEDINSKTRDPVRSVYDLAILITSRCSGVFDRHRMGDEEYQFLDMFEASIGTATDKETVLFKRFNRASAQASDWLKNHRKLSHSIDVHALTGAEGDEHKEPLFVDRLLDIGQETDLLAEAKDIRDELNMISTVLQHQQNVLADFQDVIAEIYHGQHRSQYDMKKRFKDQQRTIDMHLKDISRMDKQAERIYASITDLLDLKQKHANAFEARFARDQAAGTTRQGKIIMVFTIVTVVFLPLSFISSIFSINIEQFPRARGGSSDKLNISYVAKYTFGIGFSISVSLILVALAVDNISGLLVQTLRQIRGWLLARNPPQREEEMEIEKVLSIHKGRRSVETEFGGSLLPVSTRETWSRERRSFS